MSMHTRFIAKEATLSLTEAQTLEIEKIFGGVRAIHNHFVVNTQKLNEEQAKLCILTYLEMVDELVRYVDTNEEMEHIVRLDSVILESHLRIAAEIWNDFGAGKRHRPVFKAARTAQSFWVVLQDAIVVHHGRLVIPGEVAIELNISEFDRTDKPTVFRLSRTVENEYKLACLYEESSKDPVHVTDRVMTLWGIELAKLCSKGSSRQYSLRSFVRKDRRPAKWERAYAIRRAALTRLLNHLNFPVLYTKENHHEYDTPHRYFESPACQVDTGGGVFA